jgi:pyruvate formate lyase activating enzyme
MAAGGTVMTVQKSFNDTTKVKKLSCTEVEADELIIESVRSSPLFFDGGGVTLTGGEPTVQFSAVRYLLEGFKQNKIHTAMETNGCHDGLPELFSLIDFLIIDLKHYDSEKHSQVICHDNLITQENIKKALCERKQLLVRIPLVNGFNASNNDALMFVEFFKRLKTDSCSFELLRYHEYGKDKWAQCGLKYTVENANVSDEDYRFYIKAFVDNGLRLIRT